MEREEEELTFGVPVRKSLYHDPWPTFANFSSPLPLSICECEDGDILLRNILGFLSFDDGHCPKYQSSLLHCGSGSVVGITTGYGLDGPGIESRWG